MVKRAMDILIALTGLIVFMPVMAVAALAIKATSPGPVVTTGVRVGKNGRRFILYTFRIRVADGNKTIPKDPAVHHLVREARVTKIGSLLRKFSFGRLPQLVNVLKGEMSLVGPRPCLPQEFENFQEGTRERFQVRPGLTGLWQVSVSSTEGLKDMAMLDHYYLVNMSFWLDLHILYKAAVTVIKGKKGCSEN
jgi:lipopolysaccharide/colanic/teichoic acid biosynthesis glycosyltransferase